jgi:hypothetical protein
MEGAAEGRGEFVPNHDACPLPVDVDVVRVVEHVRSQASRGAQVDLQGDDAPVAVRPEELEVEEPFPHAERREHLPARRLQVRGDLPEGVVEDMVVVVDRFHDALAVGVRGGEHRMAPPVRKTVEGEDPPGDELLEDVVRRRLSAKKRSSSGSEAILYVAIAPTPTSGFAMTG